VTSLFKNALRVVLGIALVPFCIGFGHELASALVTNAYQPLVPYWFAGGALLYLLVHFLFRKPILAYVVGHELTHALFAMLFGGSVKSFHASERGGQVTITKSNFIITLAPYFFPLYTYLALGAYFIARAARAEALFPWLVLLAGATFAFHLVLTVVFLLEDQKDIQEHGAFFSYPLIVLFNILLTALLVRLLLARDMDFLSYLGNGIIKSLRIYTVGLTDLWVFIVRQVR
jgi:hypothetical protein